MHWEIKGKQFSKGFGEKQIETDHLNEMWLYLSLVNGS